MTTDDELVERLRAIPVLAIALAIGGCAPQAGDSAGPEVEQSLDGAKMNVWTDPGTGCRYYLYREGVGSNSLGGMSIRFRADGTPDCSARQALASSGGGG